MGPSIYSYDLLIRTRLFQADNSRLTSFRITELPISQDAEIGSPTFCPD